MIEPTSEENAMTTLATHIARFTAALDAKTMPPEVVEKARACLLNAYGMGLDCHDTPYAPVASVTDISPVGPTRSTESTGISPLYSSSRW